MPTPALQTVWTVDISFLKEVDKLISKNKQINKIRAKQIESLRAAVTQWTKFGKKS